MWRTAQNSAQKKAILNQFIPMSRESYLDAVIHFAGDTDPEVIELAAKKIRDIPKREIIIKIKTTLPAESAKALLKICATDFHGELLATILGSGKLKSEWIKEILFIKDDALWQFLVLNRNFATLSYYISESIIAFLSEFSPVLRDSYVEQLSYIRAPVETPEEKPAEKIEPVIPAEEAESEEPAEQEDGDTESASDTDEEPIDFEEPDDPNAVEIDIPDFLMSDEPFAGLSAEAVEERRKNITELLKKMTMGQKLRLASVGNMEARRLLIRDPKKQVCMAVLENKGLTAGEITQLVSEKSVSEEIISRVATSRDLTKSYQVKLALILNPKTPLRISMQFLSVLQKFDLKKIAKSKNITGTLRTIAEKKLSG